MEFTKKEKNIIYEGLSNIFALLAKENAEREPFAAPSSVAEKPIPSLDAKPASSDAPCSGAASGAEAIELAKKQYPDTFAILHAFDSSKPSDPHAPDAVNKPMATEIPCTVGGVTAYFSFMKLPGTKPFQWSSRLDSSIVGNIGHNDTEKIKTDSYYEKNKIVDVFLAQTFGIRDTDKHQKERTAIMRALGKAKRAYEVGYEVGKAS